MVWTSIVELSRPVWDLWPFPKSDRDVQNNFLEENTKLSIKQLHMSCSCARHHRLPFVPDSLHKRFRVMVVHSNPTGPWRLLIAFATTSKTQLVHNTKQIPGQSSSAKVADMMGGRRANQASLKPTTPFQRLLCVQPYFLHDRLQHIYYIYCIYNRVLEVSTYSQTNMDSMVFETKGHPTRMVLDTEQHIGKRWSSWSLCVAYLAVGDPGFRDGS